MLDKSSQPLSEDFIYSFFSEKGYTDFFTFRRSIDALGDDGLIDVINAWHKTVYQITRDGSSTLAAYGNERISPEIRDELSQYLSDGYSRLPDGGSAASYYSKAQDGSYDVKLMAFFDGSASAEFTMPVSTENAARTACEKWNANAGDIYEILKNKLV